MIPQGNVFFVFENVDSGERNYIFIKNILRFRRANILQSHDAAWAKDKVFLQFIMRDNVRNGFILTEKEWHKFKDNLPYPSDVVCCLTPPNKNNFLPDNHDEHLVIVNDSDT